MYSENEKQFSRRRSGDEFLRRMRGEDFLSEMMGRDIPTFAQGNQSIPRLDERQRTSCNGTERPDGNTQNGGGGCEAPTPSCASMPALAMVYSPVQAFRKILSPAEGLAHGSIFEELILPFEAGNQSNCKMGGCGK